ncbi:toxin-antitoxin system YwqK family antitoxin [Luteibaculum oceani]|uniref:Toxin-antitoxin system YwqK family antitoxin n=1 Tax=Luteibaculum oceani TaxID=1294296 RepID=A0A5C6VFG1_9FLAO|nr:toxin-antitoxin system YwqK family antitoxin [Luteibaculum oceani]TXC82058.1 toxin-antitoxin system YwqK family antitoxin [Luteibaculum oceani]
MKRALLFLVCSVIAIAGFSQKNTIDNQGRKQGIWEKKYQDGSTKYIGQFKDDKPVGEFIYYYPGERVKSVLNYRKPGVAYAIHLYENGVKQSEGIYVETKKDSVWTYYDKRGRIMSRETYRLGEKNGLTENYFENGNPSLQQKYENGVAIGTQKTYFENGKLKSETDLKKGIFHGNYKVYDIKGNPVLVGTYDNGKEIGVWEIYDQGILRNKVDKDTLGGIELIIPMNGEFTENYASEMPREIANYKDGKLHGTYELYYDNGRWEYVDQQDPRTGSVDKYRKMVGHTLKMRCNYVYGKKHGKCEYFFEDGSLKKVEEYKMDTLVSK